MHSKIPLILVISLLILCTKNGFSQICFPVKKIYAFFEPVKKALSIKMMQKNNKQAETIWFMLKAETAISYYIISGSTALFITAGYRRLAHRFYPPLTVI